MPSIQSHRGPNQRIFLFPNLNITPSDARDLLDYWGEGFGHSKVLRPFDLDDGDDYLFGLKDAAIFCIFVPIGARFNEIMSAANGFVANNNYRLATRRELLEFGKNLCFWEVDSLWGGLRNGSALAILYNPSYDYLYKSCSVFSEGYWARAGGLYYFLAIDKVSEDRERKLRIDGLSKDLCVVAAFSAGGCGTTRRQEGRITHEAYRLMDSDSYRCRDERTDTKKKVEVVIATAQEWTGFRDSKVKDVHAAGRKRGYDLCQPADAIRIHANYKGIKNVVLAMWPLKVTGPFGFVFRILAGNGKPWLDVEECWANLDYPAGDDDLYAFRRLKT
ncbi:MAG TPA: hypothetical protein P5056_03615 [Candidatus Paceibacterota bacterium]|nr:hypothetical protein [Candidatus Paceibacterota bacterium]